MVSPPPSPMTRRCPPGWYVSRMIELRIAYFVASGVTLRRLVSPTLAHPAATPNRKTSLQDHANHSQAFHPGYQHELNLAVRDGDTGTFPPPWLSPLSAFSSELISTCRLRPAHDRALRQDRVRRKADLQGGRRGLAVCAVDADVEAVGGG